MKPAVPAVKAFMSGDPVAVDGKASAFDALDLMLTRHFRHLPVIDRSRRVVGVLSIDDVCAAFGLPRNGGHAFTAAQQARLRGARVREVMTQSPQTVRDDGAIADAADRMADRKIGCLPVVDERGLLVGMLTETDLLRALATTARCDPEPASES
jgi:CBS domain-containing protein